MVCRIIWQQIHLDEIVFAHVVDWQFYSHDDPCSLRRWAYTLLGKGIRLLEYELVGLVCIAIIT